MPSVTFTTRGALQKSALRLANERLVLNAIRQNPGIARSDLSRITGLSASSISFIVSHLRRAKLVSEDPVENHSQVGRRPTVLRLVEDAKMAVAVEVALSGTRVGLVDLAGRLVREKRLPWAPNPEILARRIHALICAFTGQLGPRQALGVGVCLPGTLQRETGKVIAAENLNWLNVDFGRLVRGRLSLPFYFENNAKVAALAERWFTEPGRDSLQDFVFVAPAGGLGTGIVTNGHLLQGASGMAGEFGHISLRADGRKCPCGNRGCLEQYASDTALCRLYAEESGIAGDGAPDASTIVKMAREGDPVAMRVLKSAAFDLGLGFVNLVWVFNPEAIVLGGFYAEAWDLIEETIWEVLRSRAPNYILSDVRIYPSTHAADSSLLGAASLVFSHFFTRFEHGEEEGAPRSVFMHASA
jgi:predicted NBD/HSP70 family sugar kinase